MKTLYAAHNKPEPIPPNKARERKHLGADVLLRKLDGCFHKVKDERSGDIENPLNDALMSGYAMFSLKDASLPIYGALKTLFKPAKGRNPGISFGIWV